MIKENNFFGPASSIDNFAGPAHPAAIACSTAHGAIVLAVVKEVDGVSVEKLIIPITSGEDPVCAMMIADKNNSIGL